jgi:hypothetical protein
VAETVNNRDCKTGHNIMDITTHEDGTIPTNKCIFVFGSNLAGVHGAGAASVARRHFGAECYMGRGRYGKSYALPTKDKHIKSLTLLSIKANVKEFIKYAQRWPKTQFFITRIGCGLAGYKDSEIAPLFYPPLDNCSYAEDWLPYLQNAPID